MFRNHVLLFFAAAVGVAQAQGVPAINANGGVVNAATLTGSIAPGAWVTIFGSNLSSTTRTWTPSDFVGGSLPVALDGVSVTIDGLPAYVYYVSPTQLNVLAPAGGSIGFVNVQVTNAAGVSAPAQALETVASPGLFQFSPQSGRYVAAEYNDGTFAGPAGLYGSALTTRAANPGEVIELFATGLGATSPQYPDGRILTQSYPVAAAPQVTIGGQRATVNFAGLVSPGLYQLNVVVPAVSGGDQSVTIDLGGGVTSPASKSYIAIAGAVKQSASWTQFYQLAEEVRFASLSPNELFISLRKFGVMHSLDRGVTWASVTPAPGLDCRNWVQTPTQLFLGCSGAGGGVFRWNGSAFVAGVNSPATPVELVARHDGAIVALLTTQARTAISADGVNWTYSQLPNGLGLLQVFQHNPVTDDIWLGTEGVGLYRSSDGGQTFAFAGYKQGQPGSPVNGNTFIFAQDGTTMYAEHNAVYRWLPSSNSWISLATGADGVPGIPYARQVETALLAPDGTIFVGTVHSYAFGDSYVYESHDNGASYSLATVPGLPTNARVADLKMDSLGFLWAGLASSGLWGAFVR